MPRARTPTLALLLAAGISVVGPNLIEPQPVATPWSDATETTGSIRSAGPGTAGQDSMSSGALSHSTAVRASAMPSSRPAARVDAGLVATVDRTNDPTSAERTIDLDNIDDPDERSTACHTP